MRVVYVFVLFLTLCGHAVAQQVQLITENTSKPQFENASYLVVKSLTLTNGFIVSGSTPWFARAHSDAVPPTAASPNENFVRVESIMEAGITTEAQVKALELSKKSTFFTYVDGLGRALQIVALGGGAEVKDVVQPVYYDALGRASRHYLPYTTGADTPGSYRSNAFTDQSQFYATPPSTVKNDSRPYSETFFDDSPIGRITQSKAVGALWASKPANLNLKLNDASTVRVWKIENGLPKSVEYYPANSLTITESVDEESNIARSYTDFLGRAIMKEVQAPGGGWAQTYYVYSVYGLVQFIIPPMAVSTVTPDQTFADKWYFQFEYDAYQRQTGSKAPAVGWRYTIFDKLDRPVLTQDANQRSRSEWIFTKYDALNRPIFSGIYVTASTRTTLVSQLSASTGYETRNSSAVGYTLSQAFPTTVAEGDIFAISYYDDYSFRPNTGWDAEANSFSFINEGADYSATFFGSVKDLRTGGKVKILGSSPAKWLNEVVYYDDHYRMLQTISENHLGKADRVTVKYDFSGKVVRKLYVHNNAYPQTITIRERYTYDINNRLVNTYHQVNNQPEVLLSSFEYNDLGQVVDKRIHSIDGGATALQSIDYRYDIQNKITNINNTGLEPGEVDYFAQTLGYDQNPFGTAGRFDGLISGISWKHDLSAKDRIYGFTYDKGALTSASFKVNNTPIPQTGVFNEYGITYDLNGNILSLKRNAGLKTATMIDDLSYTYSSSASNQLTKVTDAQGVQGFLDGNTTGDDYSYDVNGNLVKDKNKNIRKNADDPGIEYNIFDLPEKVTFGNGDYITFSYDGTGRKLSQKYFASGGTPQGQIDYAGGFIYENGGTPSTISHSEGRLVSSSNDNLITNTTTREANATTGFSSAGAVVLSSYTAGTPVQTYVRAICNQNGGTAEVTSIGGLISVSPGATYIFKLLGYQGNGSSAGLVVKQAGGAVIVSGPIMKVGAINEDFVSSSFTVPAGVTQIQLGVSWSTPVSGNTIYINYVALYRSEWEYQYFMNDHLGSPRVVLQTQPSTKMYSATMERSNHTDENDRFLNLDINKEVNAFPAANVTPGGSYSYVMNASTPVGPGRSFKVLPGDKISASVNSYYTTGGSYSPGNAVSMATQVAAALSNGVAGAIDGVASVAYTTTGNPALVLSPNQGSTRPSAFINYILFDEMYSPLEAKSQPVPANGGGFVAMPEVNVTQTGYLYVYLSYDNNAGPDVYFDEFNITYNESAVVQINGYYPYGLPSFTWNRIGEEDVREGYQGKEFDVSTRLNDFHARQYDPVLGRFWNFDPKNQFASGYLGMGNNPVMMIDPDGEIAFIAVVGIFAAVNVASDAIRGNINTFKDGAISFGLGALQGVLAAAGPGGLAAYSGSGSGWLALGSAVAGQINIPVYSSDNFNLSISPSLSAGSTGARLGANVFASATFDNVSLSGGYSFGRNFSATDLSGTMAEARWSSISSGSIGFNTGGGTYSYGITRFGGNYSQIVGSVGYSNGKFSASMENDFLSRSGDKYRSAAFRASYRVSKDVSLTGGFSIWTGEPEGQSEYTVKGKTRPCYHCELETPSPMRNGNLFFGANYRGNSYLAGVNGEGVRSAIQNGWHNAMGWPVLRTIFGGASPHFERMNYHRRFYTSFGMYNPFTIYGQ